MRLYTLCFISMCCLSGCVNYAGIHDHRQSFDDAMLKTSYSETSHASAKPIATKTENWWSIYHDAQLNELIDTALQNSPSVQVAQSRLESAQHIAEAAGASLWPRATAYAEVQRERLTENTFFPPPFGGNRYTEINLGMTFNYEFDFWGKNHAIIAAHMNNAYAAAAEANAARLILASSITSTYFQLQYEYAELKINQQIAKQRHDIYALILTRIKHGIDSDIPATSANTDWQNANMAVAATEAQIKLSQHLLAALMGKNPFDTHIHVTKLSYNKKYTFTCSNSRKLISTSS